MDGLIVELARLLVWPLLILLAVIILREPLGRLIPTLHGLRYKDDQRNLELGFGAVDRALQAGSSATEGSPLPLPVSGASATEDIDRRLQHSQDDISLLLLGELMTAHLRTSGWTTLPSGRNLEDRSLVSAPLTDAIDAILRADGAESRPRSVVVASIAAAQRRQNWRSDVGPHGAVVIGQDK